MQRFRRLALTAALVLAVALLAGCLADDPGDPEAASASDADRADPAGGPPASVERLADGRLEVTVPVHVAVIGFEADVAERLDARLDEERVRHAHASWPRKAPPAEPTDPARPGAFPLIPGPVGWSYSPMPIEPVADYRVHGASAALEEEIRGELEAAMADDTIEANPVEDALAERLPEHGIPVREGAPTLVVLHAAGLLDRDVGQHDWTYRLPGGPLEGVRVFGERRPVLALDASAAPDDWTAPGDRGEPPSYAEPLARSGQATARALDEAARDATHFRLLQAPFYASPTAPCHSLTVVFADRPGDDPRTRPDPTDHVDLDRIEVQLDAVTGPVPVRVTAKTLQLPAGDPALAAATRGTLADRDRVRTLLDAEWETYWDPLEGCEAYVVVASATEGDFDGVAIYGEDEDRRLGLAILPGEWASHDRTFEHTILHEAAHLIGPAHPHQYVPWEEDGTDPLPPGDREETINSRWSSVWSVTSYQASAEVSYEPTIRFGEDPLGLAFGVQDRANTLRSQVGFAYRAVHEAGLGEEPEVQQALADVERLDWAAALTHLVSLLHGGS